MKVLLGLEASESGYRALGETLERAAEAGDELTVAGYGGSSERDEIVASVRERRSAAGPDTDVVELEGPPGPALIQLSEEGQYDRLVITGGERSPMGKIQLGSVTEFVLMNARTTITLVR
ncbi:MAG: universal stress protein [Haloarculaceae archaeon]